MKTVNVILALGLLVACSAESVPSPEDVGGAGTSAAGAPAAGAAAAGSATGGTPTTGAGAPAAMGGTPVASDAGATNNPAGAAGAAVSGGSGGTNAAGMAGAAGSAGAVGAGCAGDAILCEGFEQYTPAAAPNGSWTASQRGNGKIVVDTTRAFSGKQSLHVTGKMNADRANISKVIQTESPTAYVRFMFYAAGYPASSGVHTRLMRIGAANAASGNPDSSYSLASYNGTAIEKVNSIYLRDTGTKLNAPNTLNRWNCWEFAIDKSGGVGKVKVQIWLDGRELPLSPAGSSSHGMTSPSWDPIPFESFMLGLDGFQADEQAADFWIDDLLVTPQRVGCKAAP